MHIGGDGELKNCDFEVELIEFLQQIEQKLGAELTLTQRLLTLTKRKAQESSIPERTVVGA